MIGHALNLTVPEATIRCIINGRHLPIVPDNLALAVSGYLRRKEYLVLVQLEWWASYTSIGRALNEVIALQRYHHLRRPWL